MRAQTGASQENYKIYDIVFGPRTSTDTHAHTHNIVVGPLVIARDAHAAPRSTGND
jgi:hypothetical protein